MLTYEIIRNELEIKWNGWILNVQWKVSRRIIILLQGKNNTPCWRIKQFQRRRWSNCFLTANYVWLWDTSWIWKLQDILNWNYEIPEICLSSIITSLPHYWIIKNKKWVDLHAFIIIWEIDWRKICFHQRWDNWRYEFIFLETIKIEWQRPLYYDYPQLDHHAYTYEYYQI
jgi:hypothetical protein